MRLTKQHLDVGLFTTDLAAQLHFWQERVGLLFDHRLKLGDGIHQHRFHANGSIIKLNHSRHPLQPLAPSGIVGVHLAVEGLKGASELSDPDGNRLILVPPGHEGIAGLAIEMRVSDLGAARVFWRDTVGLPETASGTFHVGDSLIILRQGLRSSPAHLGWRALGWRYLTIQVEDCVWEHCELLARGAAEAAPPRDLGGVAVVSFIRDPDGTVIELSERSSLKQTRPS